MFSASHDNLIYIAVEETILSFVLASTHAARCKEEAV